MDPPQTRAQFFRRGDLTSNPLPPLPSSAIAQAADLYGPEGAFLLLAHLIERADVRRGGLEARASDLPVALLASVASRLSRAEPADFAERLARVLEDTVPVPGSDDLESLARALRVSHPARLELALALSRYGSDARRADASRPSRLTSTRSRSARRLSAIFPRTSPAPSSRTSPRPAIVSGKTSDAPRPRSASDSRAR